MTSHQQSLFPLCVIILCFSLSSKCGGQTLPRLGVASRYGGARVSQSSYHDEDPNFQSNFYEQPLDHFNYNPKSYTKFNQYYVTNSKHWGGANSSSPIFAYLGAESELDGDIPIIGFMTDNAPRFKALLVYMEHRFYGKSVPRGLVINKTRVDEDVRGYFSSAQALADYAEILLHIKQKFSAHNSPIIVVGGSYGGMLASWFRLKYPHVALGALAVSAPILYFDDITPQNGYYLKVTDDFREESENCYQTIKKSWSVIDQVASDQPNGLSILSKTFQTCQHLNKSSELKDFLDTTYAVSAQYNDPSSHPVSKFCKGVDEATEGSSVLDRIFAGIVSLNGNSSCYNMYGDSDAFDPTLLGWDWQTCTEMVMPIGRGSNDTMFPAYPFVLEDFIKNCNDRYGVLPRPHWITTYYGGHDIKLILKNFGSNIIFSNGLSDPYSSAGVLESLSKSLIAVHTEKGSHCLDIYPAKKSDPSWLVAQREVEVKIIGGWMKSYYKDLAKLKSIHN